MSYEEKYVYLVRVTHTNKNLSGLYSVTAAYKDKERAEKHAARSSKRDEGEGWSWSVMEVVIYE